VTSIELRAKNLQAKLMLKNKLTVIFDESGTGKTLITRLLDFYRSTKGIVFSDYPIRLLDGLDEIENKAYEVKKEANNGNKVVSTIKAKELRREILFIDAHHPALAKSTLRKNVEMFDGYIVIISRHFSSLPFGTSDVYTVKSENRFHWLEMITDPYKDEYDKPDVIIVEDETWGLDFYKLLFGNLGVDIFSCENKDHIREAIKSCSKHSKRIMVICNSCGLSNHIFDLYDYFDNSHVQFFAIESFEWIVLSPFFRRFVEDYKLNKRSDGFCLSDLNYETDLTKGVADKLKLIMEEHYRRFPFLQSKDTPRPR
jgi:hypothetical protein